MYLPQLAFHVSISFWVVMMFIYLSFLPTSHLNSDYKGNTSAVLFSFLLLSVIKFMWQFIGLCGKLVRPHSGGQIAGSHIKLFHWHRGKRLATMSMMHRRASNIFFTNQPTFPLVWELNCYVIRCGSCIAGSTVPNATCLQGPTQQDLLWWLLVTHMLAQVQNPNIWLACLCPNVKIYSVTQWCCCSVLFS